MIRHTQIYILYINKYIFLKAKILGGLLGPRIKGAVGAGGEDILCEAGTATMDAGTWCPRHSDSFQETCSPSQKKKKISEDNLTYGQEPEGSHSFFLNAPFPDLLSSPFPIPVTFSRFSFITGLGAEEQGGSAWPHRGSSSASQGIDLGFFTVSSSRCLGGEKLLPVVAVTVRSIKILVLLNRGAGGFF